MRRSIGRFRRARGQQRPRAVSAFPRFRALVADKDESGNPAHLPYGAALFRLGGMSTLAEFGPHVAGTLGGDMRTSDLDTDPFRVVYLPQLALNW
jgi:hypothetical protein